MRWHLLCSINVLPLFRQATTLGAVVAVMACGDGPPASPTAQLSRAPTAMLPVAGPPLESAVGVHVSKDGFAIADRMAATVRGFDASGHPTVSTAGPGRGPGELTRILRFEASPDGSWWVFDPARGMVVFGQDGTEEGNVRGSISWLTFAPISGRRAAVLDLVQGALLSLASIDGSVQPIRLTGGLHRAMRAVPDLAERVTRFTLVPSTGTDFFVIDQRDLTVWMVHLEGNGTARSRALPRPADIADEVRERVTTAMEHVAVKSDGSAALLANSWGTDDRGRLVLALASGPLALLYAPENGWVALESERYPRQGLQDVAVRGDSLYLLYETRLNVVPLPANAPPEPGAES